MNSELYLKYFRIYSLDAIKKNYCKNNNGCRDCDLCDANLRYLWLCAFVMYATDTLAYVAMMCACSGACSACSLSLSNVFSPSLCLH